MEGLKLLAEAREETGLPVVSEITDPADVEVFERYVDMLQVGARNMANFVLLKAVGQSRKPVLLKRGLSATIEEWLMAAEYILSLGQPQRHPLRARHPHLRDGHPQHPRPLGRARHPRAHPPARSSSTPRTAPGTGRSFGRWPWPAPPSARTASSSRSTPTRRRPAPTRSSRSRSRSSATSWTTCAATSTCANRPRQGPYAPTEPPAERRRLRARIDDVDARLAALLEERAELSVAVQQTRAADDHGHDVGRERELIERAAHPEGGVLTAEEREMVFGAILRVSRSAQRRSAADREAAAAAGSTGDGRRAPRPSGHEPSDRWRGLGHAGHGTA